MTVARHVESFDCNPDRESTTPRRPHNTRGVVYSSHDQLACLNAALMSAGNPITVLHFVAANQDRGGILTVVRALGEVGNCIPGVLERARYQPTKPCAIRAVTWVANNFAQERSPRLRLLRRDSLPAEDINVRTLALAALEAWRLRFALPENRRVFHGHSRAGLLVGMGLWFLGFDRLVVSVHNHGRQRWFYRFASLVLGDRLIWLTPAMKRHYDVATGNWRGCLPNFLPTMASEPRLEVAGDHLRLGGIGTLVEWKNWILVIEALAFLPAKEKALVEFHHLGSNDGSFESLTYAQSLRDRAETLGLSEHIIWRGEESSSVNLLATIDVLVLPAETEPFGLGVLEAWRAGIPVLVASGSGAAELIHPEIDGWIFKAKSPQALAEKISWLLRTRAYRAAKPTSLSSDTIRAAWLQRYLSLLGEGLRSV